MPSSSTPIMPLFIIPIASTTCPADQFPNRYFPCMSRIQNFPSTKISNFAAISMPTSHSLELLRILQQPICHIFFSISMPPSFQTHITMGTMASQIISLLIVYSTVYSGADKRIKENIKALHHWLLCEEFTSDRWISCTKGQQGGKCFNLMRSSWVCHGLSLKLAQQTQLIRHRNHEHLLTWSTFHSPFMILKYEFHQTMISSHLKKNYYLTNYLIQNFAHVMTA